MNDESKPLDKVEGSSPSKRKTLDKAAKLRAEAAQLVAAAEIIEANKARAKKEELLRDQRILGDAAIQLAENSLELARILVEGIGACDITGHDRKHLARDGSALAQLQAIIATQSPGAPAPEKPVSVPTVAWFDVAYSDKDRVPAGVLYDPEVKARCALSRGLVQQMRALGFVERHDLADRPPPVRNPPTSLA